MVFTNITLHLDVSVYDKSNILLVFFNAKRKRKKKKKLLGFKSVAN